MSSPSAELQREIERLFSYEAWLVDERRLYEWLDLFTDDATYSVAVREAVQDREEVIAPLAHSEARLFDDDKQFMTTRVKRLETSLAHAEQPPSLTRHLITNVLIHGDDAGNQLSVSSNFVVFQTRIDIADHVFFGKRDDVLRKVNGQWKITRRQIVVDKSPLPSAISVFF